MNRVAPYLPKAPAAPGYALVAIREDEGGETFTVLARFGNRTAAMLSAEKLAKRLARDDGNRVRVVTVLDPNCTVLWWKQIPRPRKPRGPERMLSDFVAVTAWSLVAAVAILVAGSLMTR